MVYLVGRNKGSGTRANALANCAFGIKRAVNQYAIGGGVIDAKTTDLVLTSVANNGYESGGDVASQLKITGSAGQDDPITHYWLATDTDEPTGVNHGWMAVAYISTSDAGGAPGNGTTTLAWLSENGVMESNGAVAEGQYSFWGNSHLYGKQGISGYQLTAGTKLFTALTATLNATAPAANGHDALIGTSWMNCAKASDTAFPTHN
jgi:hypothetical protein